jgi:hypothetical protein
MRHEEYLQRKREMEERHRAGIELLEAAYRAEAQALEILRASSGEAAPAPAARPSAVRQEPGELARQVWAALSRLPEDFDKNDLCRILGRVPNRASLHRVLQNMVFDGTLETKSFGSGRRLTVYHKAAAASKPRG